MSKLLLSIARYLVQSTLAVLGVLVFLNGLVWYLGLNWRVLTRLPDQNVGVSLRPARWFDGAGRVGHDALFG